jgi:hypothetical protein
MQVEMDTTETDSPYVSKPEVQVILLGHTLY